MVLVTGGAGFIGSHFVRDWLAMQNEPIIVIDKLTYAGNLNNLRDVLSDSRCIFLQGDINNYSLIESLLKKYSPRAILNFAAESHVDRSIDRPEHFIKTNINGTFCLLECARYYWSTLHSSEQQHFRFLQISTDEVFGSLEQGAAGFTETSGLDPSSPYSASKAAADHLVKAYQRTYQLPTIITHCSNNYGPYQYPEKLIPLMIVNALQGKSLPIYGDGLNIRDWLYVTDHCEALRQVLIKGRVGETYNIGGYSEKTNIEVVKTICDILDAVQPTDAPHHKLIAYVKDRPAHDRRYAIDASKMTQELGWKPREVFESGIKKTVLWYLKHAAWTSANG